MEEFTFDEINQEIERFKESTTRSANLQSFDIGQLCEIYRVIRPILLVLKNLPLIPDSWKKVITRFIEIVDGICPSS